MGFIGAFIVIVCVMGGFLGAGGHLNTIWQPFEVVIICGAAFGGLVIANPLSVIKAVFSQGFHALIGKGPTKTEYLELLQMLFQLFQTFRKEGPQAVEKHIEDPEKSELFKNYPRFLQNSHAVHFLCDTMKITLSADLTPYDLDDLLDHDIKVSHEEEHMAAHALGVVADAMPGLGIVAAVLGVVHTMGLLDQGVEVIGRSVASALVGTFMGVLFAYGFFGPISNKMSKLIELNGRYLVVIKAALVSLQRGSPPLVCVEYARRSIFPTDRPSFEEMDQSMRGEKTG